MENRALLEMQGINKSFVGVRALQDVDFSVNIGEVHALVGENGAGKSTLMKIVSGVYTRDAGSMVFGGQDVFPKSALEAQKIGISTIYQELNVIPELSVYENLFIGRERMRKGRLFIDWKTSKKEARTLLERVGLPNIDISQPIKTFGTAMQQMITIARALAINSRLVIMDEPTSSLDNDEVQVLFDLIRTLKKDGISIVFISHRIDEIFEICERVTILKDGRLVGCHTVADITKVQLVSEMIGRDASGLMEVRRETEEKEYGESICRLEDAASEKVRDASFDIRQGQIVGLAGLLGSGRTEIARMMFGLDELTGGDIKVNGKRVKMKNPATAIRHRFAFCPENRRMDGIIGNMSVRENITLVLLPRLSKLGIVNVTEQKRIIQEYIDLFDIKTPSMEQPVKFLSGGNQQKVILARWLCAQPQLIILDEPTRGIDVGAKQEIMNLMKSFTEKGIGVLLISSELGELIRNCSVVEVVRDGAVISELTGTDIDQDNIMHIIAEGQ